MSVRLIVTMTTAPGKGAELLQGYQARCAAVMKEPGCEQFEAFRSVIDPDKVVVLERWVDEAALKVHAALSRTQPSLTEKFRVGAGQREDYVYNRTR